MAVMKKLGHKKKKSTIIKILEDIFSIWASAKQAQMRQPSARSKSISNRRSTEKK